MFLPDIGNGGTVPVERVSNVTRVEVLPRDIRTRIYGFEMVLQNSRRSREPERVGLTDVLVVPVVSCSKPRCGASKETNGEDRVVYGVLFAKEPTGSRIPSSCLDLPRGSAVSGDGDISRAAARILREKTGVEITPDALVPVLLVRNGRQNTLVYLSFSHMETSMISCDYMGRQNGNGGGGDHHDDRSWFLLDPSSRSAGGNTETGATIRVLEPLRRLFERPKDSLVGKLRDRRHPLLQPGVLRALITVFREEFGWMMDPSTSRVVTGS